MLKSLSKGLVYTTNFTLTVNLNLVVRKWKQYKRIGTFIQNLDLGLGVNMYNFCEI